MLSWPFQAIKRAKLHITGTTSCVKFVSLLEKAKWLKRGLLIRPFADALDGPALSRRRARGERRASSKLHYGLSH